MATKAKPWRQKDREAARRAIEAGQLLQRCDCCGGYLPPREIWDELRQSGRGPDCDGTVDRDGNCRAFAEIM